MKAHETIAEMTVEMADIVTDWNRNGSEAAPIRVVTTSACWPDAGPGWVMLRQPLELLRNGSAAPNDCMFLDPEELAALSLAECAALALPLVLALPEAELLPAALADRCDGFIFAEDDPATMAQVFARVTARAPGLQVGDFADGTARTINALSAEASRIADALARLAEGQRGSIVAEAPVDAMLVRRLLKVRRDRDRYFPAEIFADPAWDMLLDLTAAQLEGKPVPVSSLCIAAAVPTTTALRWIRSLTEAGLFERRTDPTDARRTYINLSGNAATAMLSYLRMFGAQFGMR